MPSRPRRRAPWSRPVPLSSLRAPMPVTFDDPRSTRAVFFDVDFTLIYPGPTFQGEGYRRFCTRYGIDVDPARFHDAVLAASVILNDEQDHIYKPDIFVRYTRRIIE